VIGDARGNPRTELPEWVTDATAKKGDALADLADRLGRAITQVELDDVDLACIVGTSPETVTGWLSRQTTPQGNDRARLLDLVAVLEKLAGVLRSQPAHDWLFAPNDSLDHHKPVDLLRTGEFRRVLSTIDAMSEGVFV
jgi:hypothetical protein